MTESLNTQNALGFVAQCAISDGMANDIIMTVSVSLIDGEPQAHKLLVDLDRSGARLTRTKETVTAHVDYAAAERFRQLCQYGDFLIDPVARG